MIPPIGAVNYDIYNPYSYGMYGMGMCPQTLEQYRNMRKMTTDLYANQISFAGKINPLFSGFNNSERTNVLKSFNNTSVNLRNAFNPYSKENIGQTKSFMGSIAEMQMASMMNPFSIYGGALI